MEISKLEELEKYQRYRGLNLEMLDRIEVRDTCVWSIFSNRDPRGEEMD